MPIRVLHYVGKMDRGGIATFIMNLYRKIDRERVQFDFAVHGDQAGDFQEEISKLGGRFHYFPHMRKNPLKYRAAWRKFWKENGGDYGAFHMHTNSLANIIALEEAERAGVPVRIVHSHNSMANKGRLQWLNDFLHKRHQARIPRLATHLFTCSDKAAQWLFGGTSVGELVVQQINNGVDVEAFRFDEAKRKKIRDELSLGDAKIIGHIGVFLPVKNHRFLIDVVERAFERDRAARCLMIGDGPLRAEMEEIVRQKNLENVVVFLGVRRDIPDLLSAMDAFLMPSLYEGLPVSLVEVQANGLPALVSDTITKDVRLKDNLQYLDLAAGPDAWAEKALEMIDGGLRNDDPSRVIERGFDITKTVGIYEKIVVEGAKK